MGRLGNAHTTLEALQVILYFGVIVCCVYQKSALESTELGRLPPIGESNGIVDDSARSCFLFSHANPTPTQVPANTGAA